MTADHVLNDDLNLYAGWRLTPFTITYNMQGHGTAPTGDANTKYTYGTGKSSLLNPDAVTGWTFGGWYKESGCTNKVTSISTTEVGDKTFYAKWTANVYTITLDRNNGTAVKDTVYLKYDTGWYTNAACTVSLGSITTPTKSRYDYKGYSASSTATSGTYWTNVATKPATNAFSQNTTLYAAWTLAQWTITIDGAGGTIYQNGTSTGKTSLAYDAKPGSNYTTVYGASNSYQLHTWRTADASTYTTYTVKRTGYTQTGWTFSGGGSVSASSGTAVLHPTGDYQKFTASWKANDYTLTVNPNGGTVSGKTDNLTCTVTYDSSNYGNLIWANFKKTGHTFKGIFTAASGGTKIYDENGQCVPNTAFWNASSLWCYTGSPTLYAQWKANQYNLTLKTLGKDGTWTESTSKYSYGQVIQLVAYGEVGSGWTWRGWYSDEGFKNKVSGSPSSTTLKDLVFYARWTANKYTISFNGNGGSGGMSGKTLEATYDSKLPELPDKTKPIRAGYDFAGWRTPVTPVNGGELYYSADGTTDRIMRNAGNVTLLADWTEKPLVPLSLTDERLGIAEKSAAYWPEMGYVGSGTSRTVIPKGEKIADAPSLDDYVFCGWFDDDGDKMVDENGILLAEQGITAATVWHAKWERLGSSVELKANYGDMVSSDIVQGTDQIKHVAFGKTFATLLDGGSVAKIEKTPTRVGYTFMGYYTEPNPELSTEDVEEGNFKGKLWIYGKGVEDVQAGTLVSQTWLTEEEWAKAPTNLADKGAITLYAAWQLDDCIVEFDIESNLEDNTERVYVPEGSTALENRIWHYNKNMTDALPVPGDATFTRNGYTFGGWCYLDENGDEVRVSAADGTPENVLLPWKSDVEKVTLYAYWTPRTYALEFHPAFPGDEGVEQVYEGEKTIKGIDYDDDLMLVSPDFGAYDFAGWYVGVPDGTGGWKASDVPFSDWTLRNGEEVKGLHTTAMVEQDGAAYVTYEGRFTPHDPLVGQTYDEASPEPAVIHVVAKWEDPVKRYIHFYAGLPEESLDKSTRDYAPEYYKFAKAYPIDPTYLPNVGKDGWKCKGWVEVESEEEAMEYLKSGYVGDEKDPGVSNIEAMTTRASYKDLYFVAKWTICPLSVTLVTEENEDGTYVKGTDELVDADSWNATPKTDSFYAKAYDVRQAAFTLPNLSRKGYDFKGWVRQGSDDTEPKRDYPVNPADQAKLEANHDLVFEPVFEEIEYTIYLEPNGGGLERQERKAKFTDLFDFSASYPVALHRGSVFECWATKFQKPFEDDGTYREFTITSKVPMSEETDGMEDAPFYLTDLTDDESRTIYLYGIWFGDFYSVEVPLTVNMAVDTETGDVVAAKTTLKPRKGNEDKVYTVESLRYEPVSDERGVPFQGASNVYFSVYPGITFQNDADAYYFLQKDKVGSKGIVTYTNAKGDLVTSTPLLIELGRASATPKLFTKTKSTTDANEVTLDSMTDATSGFYSFSAEKPLDVYYGLHFEGEKREWVNVLQKFAYGNNGSGWELPENDAGYQRYTGLPDDEGRRLGWSSGRVDIAKVRYTLSMQTKTPTE